MSRKLTKKELVKANKVAGGRAVYGDGIKTGAAYKCDYPIRKTSKDTDGIAIITTITKKTTKRR
ncbi:MAG: hypothetical protein MJ214_04960 [Bacilli bacterium]|nr:hypothetical protein [Bacilli bacterium]